MTTKTLEQTGTAEKEALAPRYHVVLLDDDDHSYAYVIEMLQKLFGYSSHKALELTETVDREGRAIVLTTSLEYAELKRNQILAFGADPLILGSNGSMRAIIERAP